MKRVIVIMLALAFALTACGGNTTTKTFTAEDFKPVTLAIADFPEGFEMLSVEDAQAMGLDLTSFESSLQAFTKAKPVNTVVAMNSNFENFQFVAAFICAPMTKDEVQKYDEELNNPETARTEFAEGLGGEATFLSGADSIGEKSIGFDLSIDSSGITLRGELVISRRGVGLQMVILLYLDGVQPQVSAVQLAKKLDTKLADVQK